MTFFLTNGEVAWEIPTNVGRSYQSGRYLTPPGWDLLTWLPKKWRQRPGGEYRNLDSLDKLLKEAGFNVR
jgi:hypothetical protein